MKISAIKKSLVAVGAGLMLSSMAQADGLQTLKNMERERAVLVTTFFDPANSIEVREQKVERTKQRLADLEQMVIRDDKLLGNTHRFVAHAFGDYELSFLVHASAEANQLPVALWLAEVGLDASDIQKARVGRR